MQQQVGDVAYAFQVLVAPIARNSSAQMTAPATVAAGRCWAAVQLRQFSVKWCVYVIGGGVAQRVHNGHVAGRGAANALSKAGKRCARGTFSS